MSRLGGVYRPPSQRADLERDADAISTLTLRSAEGLSLSK
jgi:hypothetical protein